MEVRWRAVSTVINYSVVRLSVLTMEEAMTLPIDDPRLFVDLDVLLSNHARIRHPLYRVILAY